MANIHKNLKNIRISKGVTQEEIAEKIGLTRQAISAYESGKRQPGIDILIKFSAIYGVEMEEILYGRVDVEKHRRKVKWLAVSVAAVFLIFQIMMGTFSIMSQVLYPLHDGIIESNMIETMEKHFALSSMSEIMEKLSSVVLFYGMLVVVILDLRGKGRYSWKKKVAFYFGLLGASWMIAILTGIIHPLFNIIDFVVRGPIHFVTGTILLIIDLVISSSKKHTKIEF